MARLKISAAAQLAGVSKSTLHRAMNAGRISFETDEQGVRWLDPSEIARVYAGAVETHQRNVPRHAETRAIEPSVNREIQLLCERLADKDAVIDDLRRRLDQAEDERRQLSLRLLSDQRPWWRRWRG